MKGNIRIGGAMVLAVAIVAGAAFAKQNGWGQNVAADGSPLGITATHQRDHIPVDTDTDGVSDWRASFSRQVAETEDSQEEQVVTTYKRSSNSLTAKVAQNFFQDYIRMKKIGDISPETQQEFFQQTLTEFGGGATQAKQYSLEEIPKITPDSFINSRNYGDQLGMVILGNLPGQKTEIELLHEAFVEQKSESLQQLASDKRSYLLMLNAAKKLSVPKSFAILHITFLNSLSQTLTDIETMLAMESDPFNLLASIQSFKDTPTARADSLKAIAEKFVEEKVVYDQNDPGYIFKSFLEL